MNSVSSSLRFLITLALLSAGWVPVVHAWQAQPSPIMTPWGEKVDPANVWPEYPRPQLERDQWQNLNGLWNFSTGPDRPVVPADYHQQILVPFPVESALSGVADHLDMTSASPPRSYWYERTFTVPDAWKGKHVQLNFGAANWKSEVLVNGKSIGTHTGGYDPFSYDITSALTPSGEQTLEVHILDQVNGRYGGMIAKPVGKQRVHGGGIFYTASSGIWQTVWLEPVAANHITGLTFVPNIDTKTLHLQVDTNTPASVAVQIEDAAAHELQSQSIPSGQAKDMVVSTGALSLWSPESPYLYHLKILLKDGTTVVDQVKSYFGMRKINIGIGKDGRSERIFLNNKEIFQVGPLDQGFWPDGLYTPPSDAAMTFDLTTLKSMGMNMLRKHIKIEPARYYYHCDQIGLLVWQDVPCLDGDYGASKQTPAEKANFTSEMKRDIKSLYNEPSIVTWVVFNEGWGEVDAPRNIQDVLHLDSSRLVDPASGWVDVNLGQLKDNHAYPGPSYSPAPGRASVAGEFGGVGLPVPGHMWKEAKNPYQSVQNGAELTSRIGDLLDAAKNGWYGGLNAAVYTETTDVEEEVNGLMTYDRKVIKADVPQLKAKITEVIAMPQTADYSQGGTTIRIVLTPDQAAKIHRLRIAGSYNGWASPQLMTSKGDGTYEFLVYNPLLKGAVEYRFYPGEDSDWKDAEGPDSFHRHYDAAQKEVVLQNVTFGQE